MATNGLRGLVDRTSTKAVGRLALCKAVSIHSFAFVHRHVGLAVLSVSNIGVMTGNSGPTGTVPAGTFDNCRSLRRVGLPGSLAVLGGNYFGTANLRGVRVPTSINACRCGVFLGYDGLERIVMHHRSPT